MYEIRLNDEYSHLFQSKRLSEKDHDTLPMIRDKTLLTRDLIKRFQDALAPTMDILPPNCRYSRELSNRYKMVVVEEMPNTRTIGVDLSMERTVEKLKSTGKLEDYGFEGFIEKQGERPYTFSLSFPFLVYLFVLDPKNYIARLRVFYRLSPITSTSDYLLQTNLLNVNSSNNACIGERKTDREQTLAESVNDAIKRFWTNTFNPDYHDKYDIYHEVPEVSDYLTWSYLTKQNPMFIFHVKWLKHSKTLGAEIDSTMEGAGCSSSLRNFENIADLFVHQHQVEVKTKERKKTVRKSIFTSRSDSIFLDDRELSVGETIKFRNGKEVKVYSFLAPGSTSPTHMQLIDSKHKISMFRLRPTVMKFLNERFDTSKVFPSIKLPNGEIIKIDDVVAIDYPMKTYKKVQKITLGIDGKVDVQLSHRHYLAANLNAKVVDISKFTFKNVKLTKDKDYIMVLPQGGSLPLASFKKVKFVGIDVQRYGDLAATFREGSSHTFKLSLNEALNGRGNEIYNESDLTQVSTFRIGVNLFTNDVANTTYLLSNQVLLHQDRWKLEFNREVAKADILKNKDEIEIKSFGLDIQFRVGDKVVVADWMDPSQMLKVNQIVGFTLDSDDILFINLKHKDEEKSIPYIDFSKGRINTGLVRKITNCYNGIKAGTKIKAKISGISGFPMKDTNIIIGFVIDTGGLPLILCSNCYTLWPFNLEGFDIIPRSSHMWKKLEHAPLQPGRVTFQPGDMFISEPSAGKSSLYTVYLGRFNSLCAVYSEDFAKAFTWGTVTHTFDSIPVAYRYGLFSPRYTQTQLKEFGKIYGFPNFHGLFTKVAVKQSSSMGFRVDRRLLDV